MSRRRPVELDPRLEAPRSARQVPLAAVLAGFLIALNLRPAVTSVAGGFPVLGAAFGPAFAPGSPWLLVLGSAPLLAFGLSAPLGPWLARRWSLGRTLAVAMVVLAAALALRATSPALLLPGTILAGAVIMIGSVLLPQLVKEFDGATWLSGVTTMGMGAGAAMGAGLLAPMTAAVGLTGALAGWAVPAVVAAAVVSVALRRKGPTVAAPVARTSSPEASSRGSRPLLRSRTALAVVGYFGVQGMLFFTVTSWLPTFLADRGMDHASASGYLGLFNVAGLPSSLLVPLMLAKPAWQRAMGSGLGLMLAGTYLWILVAPLDGIGGVVALLGVAQSGAFSYALAMVVVRTVDSRTAGSLSALSQGAGYTLAAIGPFAAGAIAQSAGGWDVPFFLMAGAALSLVLLGTLASRGPAVGAGHPPPVAGSTSGLEPTSLKM